jgi:hypothetical protein
MRTKLGQFNEAFNGHFDAHHRFLLAQMFDRMDTGLAASSAGKTKGIGSTGHGNRYLARVLGEHAVVAGRTNSDTVFPPRSVFRLHRRTTTRSGRPR